MKVLHLFSNSKWTGPAEPALNLCLGLRQQGVECDFACAPGDDIALNKIVEVARVHKLEPILQFRLDKHQHPLWNWRDARALARFLSMHPYDLLHCHLDNDHRIAVAANRSHGLPIIRSSYEGTGLNTPNIQKPLQHTRLLIEPSEMAKAHDCQRYALPQEHVQVVDVGIDTHRFDPARNLPDGRLRLKLPADALVVGIVARMQTHRHYEDLFLAFSQLRAQAPQAHLVVVGRGTKQDQVGFKPVETLGLQECVHFTGYLDGEDYVGMLRAFDFAVFLVPGSDGTCRAVRELLAMGKPLVVADRGMLRELVRHEREGLVCDGSVTGLTESLLKLAQDPASRLAWGANARTRASESLSLEKQAATVAALYDKLLTTRLQHTY